MALASSDRHPPVAIIHKNARSGKPSLAFSRVVKDKNGGDGTIIELLERPGGVFLREFTRWCASEDARALLGKAPQRASVSGL